jgi:cobalt/nickel transport system permease protein
MHISEGVLSAPVLVTGVVLSVAGVAIGLKKMDYEKLPEVGVLSSVFFVASLIHVPIGPSAAHLVLNGICGLILGWMAFPAILVGLVLQAVLFQFGGLTTLGINTFNMVFPAVLVGFMCGRFIRSPNVMTRGVAEFIAGAGAIFCSGILVATSLIATGESFYAAAKLIVLVHIPIMVMEGIITIFVIEFVRRVRPEMLRDISWEASRSAN